MTHWRCCVLGTWWSRHIDRLSSRKFYLHAQTTLMFFTIPYTMCVYQVKLKCQRWLLQSTILLQSTRERVKCLYPSKKTDRLICKQIVPLRSGRLKGVWCIYVTSYMFPSLGLLCTANDAWDALESLQSHVCSAVERCWRCSTFLNLVLCPLLVCVSFYLNVLLFMHIFHPYTMQQQRHETVSIMQIAHKAMAQGRVGASYCSLARQSNRSGEHDVTQRVQRTHIDNARVYNAAPMPISGGSRAGWPSGWVSNFGSHFGSNADILAEVHANRNVCRIRVKDVNQRKCVVRGIEVEWILQCFANITTVFRYSKLLKLDGERTSRLWTLQQHPTNTDEFPTTLSKNLMQLF